MNFERIFPEDGTIFAEIQRCLAGLNFSTHAALVTRGILRESSRHPVFLWRLDPSTRLLQTEGRGNAFVESEGNKNFEAVTSGVRLKAFHLVPGKFPSSGGTA